MSATELRALLADADQNGAYFVDVRDREALEEIARELGFAIATVDLAGCDDKDEVLLDIQPLPKKEGKSKPEPEEVSSDGQ